MSWRGACATRSKGSAPLSCVQVQNYIVEFLTSQPRASIELGDLFSIFGGTQRNRGKIRYCQKKKRKRTKPVCCQQLTSTHASEAGAASICLPKKIASQSARVHVKNDFTCARGFVDAMSMRSTMFVPNIRASLVQCFSPMDSKFMKTLAASVRIPRPPASKPCRPNAC